MDRAFEIYTTASKCVHTHTVYLLVAFLIFALAYPLQRKQRVVTS